MKAVHKSGGVRNGAVGLLLAAACAAAVPLASLAEVTAKSYIQGGLVSHWDGIENAGYGLHDDTTNVWTDLKGFCDLEIVDADSSWTANAFLPPQKGYAAAAKDNGGTAKIAKYAYASIDVCITRKAYSNAAMVLGQGERSISWQKNGFVCHYSKKSCLANLVAGTPYSIYAEYKSGAAAVITNYLDGVPVAEVAVEDNLQDLYCWDRFQIGRDLNTYWSSTAPVNSVRLYSRALEQWEIQVNANVDQIRYRESDGTTLTWPDGLSFADGSVRYRTTATAATYLPSSGAENKISVNAGEPAASVTAWKPAEGTCTLTPVPDANHRFALWAGEVDGLAVAADGTLTLDNRVRNVTCYFVPKTSSTTARIWTGAAGDENWTTAGNWSPAGVPAENDILAIPLGMTAVLGTGTDSPNYLAVECGGTLVMSNWTTRLRVIADVNVRSGGVLTCGAAATNMTDMSRVWISCSNLNVVAGGSIDVTRKGYYGHVKVDERGHGPGSISSGMAGAKHGGYAAPSHGGYGGGFYHGEWAYGRMLPYDDPAAPSLPGSSGASNPQSYGGDGGGVVRIEATGTVTVNGSILADGRDTASYGNATTSSAHGQPGSGGSIWITCSRIAGGGVIRAAGGGGDNAPYFRSGVLPGAAAGGGMIAIDYDPSLQTPADVAGMTISSAAGLYKTANFETTCVDADSLHCEADIGTLHFTDAKIVESLIGKGLTGQIRGLSSYTHNGDLEFMNGHVRFADIGVAVAVNGDLKLGGDGVARLEVGGSIATNRYVYLDLYAGTVPPSLSVGGNLTLGGRSRLDIRAAATNGVDAFGAVVSVGGAMTIGSNCVVTASSDVENLGAPKFEVGSLTIATGGVFTAEARGGRGGYGYRNESGPTQKSTGAGPGRGYSMTGASYGGKGGGNKTDVRPTYGNEARPLLPGSGGSCYSYRAVGGSGGGLVYVSATNGTISVDGTINADGGTGGYTSYESRGWGYGGGGSGGAILLESRFFRLGETGVLTARGGGTVPYQSVRSGSGGGGRIAVWCGEPWSSNLPRSRRVTSTEPLAGEAAQNFVWEGTASVAAGEATGEWVLTEGSNISAGDDGTILFGFVRAQYSCRFVNPSPS